MAQTPMARERLFALREQIARLEGSPVAAAHRDAADAEGGLKGAGLKGEGERPRLSFQVPLLDEALDGGLPLDGLSELRSPSLRDAAATGFALALAALLQNGAADRSPVLWISDRVTAMEQGLPYALGLKDIGLEPALFLHAVPRRLEDALWLAESAIESGAFLVSILEVRGNPAHFGLTESRRLSLRAKAAGRPLLLLRQAGEEEASSAAYRLLVEPAPSTSRFLPDGSMLGGSIGNPVFRLTLEKSRNPAPLSLALEWNSHDRQFLLARGPDDIRLADPFATHPGARLPASSHRPDRPPAMGPVLAFDRAS